jgi:hypothetical protein
MKVFVSKCLLVQWIDNPFRNKVAHGTLHRTILAKVDSNCPLSASLASCHGPEVVHSLHPAKFALAWPVEYVLVCHRPLKLLDNAESRQMTSHHT